MVEVFRVVSGQHQLSAEIDGSVGVHIEVQADRDRQIGQRRFGNNNVEGRRKSPNFRAGCNILASENAQPVNRARRDPGLDHEHRTCPLNLRGLTA